MRRLPVYFLIDVSESMVGEPIQEVEKGMGGIINELRSDPYALETVWVAILVFAGKAETLVPLTELIDFKPPVFPVGSGTSLGKGLELLMRDLDRNLQRTTTEKKGDWKPIIFLFTDGAPTDNPGKAIEKWNREYRARCNLIVVTFGPNADVPLLSRLSDTVLALGDSSPAAFREFFKWVTASIQVSSVAVSEAGNDGLALPSTGINLEKAKPGDSLDENFAVLRIKCSKTKKLWLAKYQCGEPDYDLVGGYMVDEDRYNALGGTDGKTAEIHVSRLRVSPECPQCHSQGMIHCGKCGQLSCCGNTENHSCPWCGNSGKIVYDSNFNVSRGQG